MAPLIVGIDDLRPERFGELNDLLTAGTDVYIEHRNGHRVPLVFAPLDPSIPNCRLVVLGLHAGLIEMAPDFNAPLPSEAWGGAFE
jgi:hypothetical protein